MKPRRLLPLFIALLTSLAFATPALPHKGKLDDLGCHKERSTSYYHCHEGQLAGRKFAQPTGAKRALAKLQARELAARAAVIAPPSFIVEKGHVYGPYQATVVRVVEGAQIVLDVALWPGLAQRIELHLSGVTPPDPQAESSCEAKAAKKAQAFTEGWLSGADTVTISGIEPAATAGRVRGDLQKENADLGQALVDKGLARPAADIGQPWC